MFRRSKLMKFVGLPILGMFLLCAYQVNAQTTSFAYQGRLQDGGTPANGSYDLQFTLWDNLSGGTQQPVASPVTVIRSAVAVSGGIFTVQLDFGVSALPGADRFLEIGVRPAGGASFTLLSPRQQITATPYAIRTLSATTADGLSSACVSCVQDSQINGVAGSKVSGAIPVADVPAGSGKYIQNSTSPQVGTNFNIDGTGTVGSSFSAAQYNIASKRVLGVSGSSSFTPTSNTFAGIDAGSSPAANYNSFFGNAAGASTIGGSNSFFGYQSGNQNSTGNGNSFFGVSSGWSNQGSANSFFGTSSGYYNSTGSNNSFFGFAAGNGNDTGSFNTAVGPTADFGLGNLTKATAIGSHAVVNGSNSTAIGAGAFVDQSNSLVLGSINGVNNATADTNVGIGTTKPSTRLDVAGNAFVRGSGTLANNPGAADLHIGYGLAPFGTAGSVSRLALQPYGHTGGPWKFVARDDATTAYLDWVYGPATTGITQDGTGKVGIGTGKPDNTLSVNGSADKPGGGSWGTFSDERLKNIRGRFTPGLNAVMRLQPLRYEYKPDNALGIKSEGEHIGFSAQQVQQVIPEAVSRNDKGYLLVNNDPILWTMLNAIKEQQAQIERQQKQIDQLKRVACHAHAKARVCR